MRDNMTEFKARLDGERIILETVSGAPLLIREVIVKYSVTSLSPSDERSRRTITDETRVEKVTNRLEIPTRGLDVVEVTVIYKKGESTLREDLAI